MSKIKPSRSESPKYIQFCKWLKKCYNIKTKLKTSIDIFKHVVEISEKFNRQNSLFHPVIQNKMACKIIFEQDRFILDLCALAYRIGNICKNKIMQTFKLNAKIVLSLTKKWRYFSYISCASMHLFKFANFTAKTSYRAIKMQKYHTV